MKVLSKKQIIMMHEQLVNETGGMHGIMDEGLLESALAAPFQTFDGKDMFPSIYQKAARLGYGLASNHAFVDGNKRIGAHAMLVFLSINEIELEYTQESLYQLFVGIANGTMSYSDVLRWIIIHRII
jgi:death-on-curing protein